MTDFAYFTVTGLFRVFTSDSDDPGGDPDLTPITGLVTFNAQPSRADSETLSPMTTVLLEPIVGRIEEDGTLRTLDSAPVYYLDGETRNLPPVDTRPVFVAEGAPPGDPAYWKDDEGTEYPNPDGVPVYGVRLVANNDALGLESLEYKAVFSKVVFNKQGNRTVDPITFTAPTEDVTVSLTDLATPGS